MNLNRNQYRNVDLTIFAVLVAVFEAINIFAIKYWFTEELFTISLLIPLAALVIMRWGAFGIFHAALSGFVYCILQSENWKHYIIYIVGNCFVGLVLLMFLVVDKQKIRNSPLFSLIYVVIIYLLTALGRTVVSVCLGESILLFVEFALTDLISAVIGMVIVLIARRQDGLFEDQDHFLMRLEQQRAEQRRLKDQGMQ